MKMKYHCEQCGLEREANIEPRSQGELIEEYVERAARVAQASHSLLSPVCFAKTVDLMLPITTNGIGFPGEELSTEELESMKKQIGQ